MLRTYDSLTHACADISEQERLLGKGRSVANFGNSREVTACWSACRCITSPSTCSRGSRAITSGSRRTGWMSQGQGWVHECVGRWRRELEEHGQRKGREMNGTAALRWRATNAPFA